MNIDANDKEFQEYARSINYGYNHPRCDPENANFDPQLDNETALVALNDGCYNDHSHPGRFARLEEVFGVNRAMRGEFSNISWYPIIFLIPILACAISLYFAL